MLYRLILFISIVIVTASTSYAEKVYVVEREMGSIAVIEDYKFKKEIKNLGNLNHATVKFSGGFGYVISRDGYLSKIDITSDTVLKKVKTGNSGIGLTFVNGFLAVANYDPKNVVILDSDLNIIKILETGSRNVGIKSKDNLLVFSLMDKNEVWVVDASKEFEIIKVLKDVGKMPFDALLAGQKYVVGFFKQGGVGILDLASLKIRKKELRKSSGEPIYKIPHFGLWGVLGQTVFIPGVGKRRINVLDLENFDSLGQIELPGNPVFVSVSPDGENIAVNYSKDTEDTLTIIDSKTRKVLKNIDLGRRLMHMRFSNGGERLYVSSFFENKVKILKKDGWEIQYEIDISTPSGVFLVPK